MLTLEHYTKTHHHDTYPALSEVKLERIYQKASVFITGAGTGIGQAIALAFARADAGAIFLAGRTRSTLKDTESKIHQISKKCMVECYVTDITDSDQVNEAFTRAHTALGGPIDVLVNNAGHVSYLDKTSDSPFDKIWQHFEVNVKGSLLAIDAFLKHARPLGATLINVTSGAAVINFADGLSAYSSSKVATMKMVDYLNREEAGRELRVFNLHPGVVPTAMAAEGKQNMQDTGTLKFHLLRSDEPN